MSPGATGRAGGQSAGQPGGQQQPSTPDVLPEFVQIVAPADLRRACELLREDVAALALPLEVPGVPDARRDLADMLSQLDDYLLPRLRRIDAPLLAVVGGSTGAGKSTLVNSLVRRFVTRSGVLRPTTRSPVLIHHPYDSGAFLTQRILPGFARVTSEAPEPEQAIEVDAPRVTALRLVPDEGLAPGLAIIDAPDVDSLVETNRDLAVQLLAAADLWIFVTTAARYSDAVPWEMLRTAVDRGVSVAIVLDRVPPEGLTEVRLHLATMLRDQGLGTAPLFTVPESSKDADGFLPEEVVAPLHGWLSRLARDARSRDVVVRRTLVGALDSLHERVRLIAAASEVQVTAADELRAGVTASFESEQWRLAGVLADGSLLRGEVLARWQEFVGTGELLRRIDASGMGRLRDRLSAVLRGRVTPSAALQSAVRTAVGAALSASVRNAVDQTAQRWSATPAGAALLARLGHPVTVSLAFDERLGAAVSAWQDAVLELVRGEWPHRRGQVKASALGPEGVAGVLTLLALGERTGPDHPVTALARRVMVAVLGDSVDALTRSVLADLRRRAAELLAGEQARFTGLLDGMGVRDDLAVALKAHVRSIERAR